MDVQIDNVSNMPTNYDYMNSIGTNPWSLIFLSAVILVYYLIFATLGGGAQGGRSIRRHRETADHKQRHGHGSHPGGATAVTH